MTKEGSQWSASRCPSLDGWKVSKGFRLAEHLDLPSLARSCHAINIAPVLNFIADFCLARRSSVSKAPVRARRLHTRLCASFIEKRTWCVETPMTSKSTSASDSFWRPYCYRDMLAPIQTPDID